MNRIPGIRGNWKTNRKDLTYKNFFYTIQYNLGEIIEKLQKKNIIWPTPQFHLIFRECHLLKHK